MGTPYTNKRPDPIPARVNQAARLVVDAAFAVHSKLGPGLLESVYQVCLEYELKQRTLFVDRQVALPVRYEGLRLEEGFRLDLLVEGCMVVEVKALDSIAPRS